MGSIASPHFYVYVLARPNGKPFYVGKGTGDRVRNHETEARSGHRCYKCNIIRKIWKSGGVVQRYIMLTTNDEQEAFAYEVELIAMYGRKSLTNKTDGGDGAGGTSWNTGRKQTPETIAKRVAKLRGQKKPPLSEEQRRRIGELSRQRKLSPDHLEALRQANLGRKMSQDNRQKLIASRAKTYEGFIAPDGMVYRNVTNLAAFSREHGVNRTSMIYLDTGRIETFRGWRRVARQPIKGGPKA